MKEDEPLFKLKQGDVLEVKPYRLSPYTKVTVVKRLSDGFDPFCTVRREQVEILKTAP